MVFYETYLMFSKRMSREDIRLLLHQASDTIQAHNGIMFKIRDLGWRKSAIRVDKPRVGVFHYGRWFYVAFGADPQTPKNLFQLYNSNSGVLRCRMNKIKRNTMLHIE